MLSVSGGNLFDFRKHPVIDTTGKTVAGCEITRKTAPAEQTDYTRRFGRERLFCYNWTAAAERIVRPRMTLP